MAKLLRWKTNRRRQGILPPSQEKVHVQEVQRKQMTVGADALGNTQREGYPEVWELGLRKT